MRAMQEDDAVYRVVIASTYAPLDGAEKPRMVLFYYGPYSTRRVASAGLTRLLKRGHGAVSVMGWVERATPVWEKASLVKERL